MKLAIYSSRGLQITFEDIDEGINKLGIEVTEIVYGVCENDAGKTITAWAEEKKIPVTSFQVTLEEQKEFGQSAGPRKNKIMAEYADAGLGFWDGKSVEVKNMNDHFFRKKKPILVVKK